MIINYHLFIEHIHQTDNWWFGIVIINHNCFVIIILIRFKNLFDSKKLNKFNNKLTHNFSDINKFFISKL
jgi:hypothetical protein